ncbi:hypothetical protein TWF694_001667 [Orbilia ellipsospora]|uniref:Uncharacterized protein n=1 Tax=Orbilia ellipsospora TaxID=2528407 RepID=A0AAV9X386_9PEZI
MPNPSKYKSSSAKLRFAPRLQNAEPKAQTIEQLRAESKALDKKIAAMKLEKLPKLPTYATVTEADDSEYEAESSLMAQQKPRAVPRFCTVVISPSPEPDKDNQSLQARRPVRKEKTSRDINEDLKSHALAITSDSGPSVEESIKIVADFKSEREKQKLRPIVRPKSSPAPTPPVVPRKRGRPPKVQPKSPLDAASTQQMDDELERSLTLIAIRQLADDTQKRLQEVLDHADDLKTELALLQMQEKELIAFTTASQDIPQTQESTPHQGTNSQYLSSSPLAAGTPELSKLVQDSSSDSSDQEDDSDSEFQPASKKWILALASPNIQELTDEERDSFIGQTNLACRFRRASRLNNPKPPFEKEDNVDEIEVESDCEFSRNGREEEKREDIEDDYEFELEGSINMGDGVKKCRPTKSNTIVVVQPKEKQIKMKAGNLVDGKVEKTTEIKDASKPIIKSETKPWAKYQTANRSNNKATTIDPLRNKGEQITTALNTPPEEGLDPMAKQSKHIIDCISGASKRKSQNKELEPPKKKVKLQSKPTVCKPFGVKEVLPSVDVTKDDTPVPTILEETQAPKLLSPKHGRVKRTARELAGLVKKKSIPVALTKDEPAKFQLKEIVETKKKPTPITPTNVKIEKEPGIKNKTAGATDAAHPAAGSSNPKLGNGKSTSKPAPKSGSPDPLTSANKVPSETTKGKVVVKSKNRKSGVNMRSDVNDTIDDLQQYFAMDEYNAKKATVKKQ